MANCAGLRMLVVPGTYRLLHSKIKLHVLSSLSRQLVSLHEFYEDHFARWCKIYFFVL